MSHRVKFTDTGFTIEHPLEEREAGSLLDCPLQEECSRLDEPPFGLGIYEVEIEDLDALEEGDQPTYHWSKDGQTLTRIGHEEAPPKDTKFTDYDIFGFDKSLCLAVGDALVRMAAMAHGYPPGYPRDEPGEEIHELVLEAPESDQGFVEWTTDLREHGEALLAYAGPDGFSQIWDKYHETAPRLKAEDMAEWERQLWGSDERYESRPDLSGYRDEENEIDNARIQGAKAAFRWIAEWLPALWD